MDTTNLFLATVKMLKTRNKNLDAAPAMASTRIRETCHFTHQAKAVVKDLTQLRDFLLSHRRDYVNMNHSLGGTWSMTDYERDQIDTQSQTVLKTCTYVLKNLRNAVRVEKCSTERYQHRQEMVEIVFAFLAAVAKIYGEQKAIRVTRAVDMKKLFRLENMIKFTQSVKKRDKPPLNGVRQSTSPGKEPNKEQTDRKSPIPGKGKDRVTAPKSPTIRRRNVGQKPQGKIGEIEGKENAPKMEEDRGEKSRSNRKLAAIEEDVRKQEEEWSNFQSTLSDNDKKQLAVEKEQLFHELRSTTDDIELIQGKVTEIAQLQDIFTSKVLEQEQDIYRINETAIHTTENIKAGNESIREAMKKKAGFRVYILFFLLVMSFTLLFLDWYNP